MVPRDSPDHRLTSSDRRNRHQHRSLQLLQFPDQDLTLGHNAGPDISLDLDSQLAIHFSPFLRTLTFPDSPLFPAHKPFRLSLSSPSLPCTLSPQQYPPTQRQSSWLGHRCHLIEYCPSQPQEELLSFHFPVPGLRDLGQLFGMMVPDRLASEMPGGTHG